MIDGTDIATAVKLSVPKSPAGIATDDSSITDRWQRSLRYLRLSVTDRCNYSCHYCMPDGGWEPTERKKLLSLEEIARVVRIVSRRGVRKIRLTGGEPLLRKDLCQLIEWISTTPGIEEVAMTTNGHLLGEFAGDLYKSGLRRLTVSIDTFDPSAFKQLTGGDLARVLGGIDEASRVGFQDISINVVAMKRVNQGQLAGIASTCWTRGWTPRFIELMPIGGLPAQDASQRIGHSEMIRELQESYDLRLAPNAGRTAVSGPAQYYDVESGPFKGLRLGTISPMTDPHFCGDCNRARLTARGGFRSCLASDEEAPVLQAIRAGASDDDLVSLFTGAMNQKREAHRMTDGSFVPLDAMTGIGG